MKLSISLKAQIISVVVGGYILLMGIYLLSSAYIIGQNNYDEAQIDIAYSEGSDSDIEIILYQYGFDIEWHESPSTIDYITSGFYKVP